jgi:membrane-bound lytic murein transglycosylase
MWKNNLNIKKKSKEEMKAKEERLEAFTVVHAESSSGLYTEQLVPIYEEYDKRNLSGEKAFRMVPRDFAAKLLKFEPNSMIPETNFTEEEKQALNAFAKRNYFKSAKVAGKRVYFGLNSKIRRYLATVLGHVK